MADEKSDDEKMYRLICKERFDNIDKSQQEIISLLRGKNGDPGLLDDVRDLKRRWTLIFAVVGVLSTVMITQLIQWLLK